MTTRQITYDIHLRSGRGRQRSIASGTAPSTPSRPHRVPRVARLMALAIRLDELIRSGEIRDRAELASLGHVTRARVTQVQNLLNLAADLQEEILSIPPVERGRDPLGERDLRPIVSILDWRRQRAAWRSLLCRKGIASPLASPRKAP